MFATFRKLTASSSLALFTVVLGLTAVAPARSAYAQSATTGAITGTVTDSNGALLPNTAVVITSADNGVTRKVKTNSSGEYRAAELQPGTYTVTFTADGFQTAQESSVTVTVGGLVTVSPKLTVGSVADKVEVSEEAPLMHLQSNEISTTLDQNAIDNLPINGRRWSDFALLTPGVVSNSDGFGLLSFRGISYLLNNSTVDGADDNQAYFSEARGRTRSSYTVTQGAVQEFQVNTSNYSAEYGRAAGGVINTVTKSGSNKLRGELFFYDRDNSLGGANNPYTKLTTGNATTGFGQAAYRPKDWRKQWGFGVGGAILKDRIFWFYAYDQSRRNFPGTARTTDPADLLTLATPLSGRESCSLASNNYFGSPEINYTSPDGNFSQSSIPISGKQYILQVPGNLGAQGLPQYPVGQTYQGNFGACALAAAINPTGNLNYQAAAAYYNQGLGIMSTFFGAVPRTGDQVINFPKIDWQINDRNRLTVQYNRLRWDSPNGVQTQTSNFYGRGSYGNDFVKADVGIFRFTTVLTNAIVNSALVQYGRDMETENPSAPTANEAKLVNPLPNGECSAPGGKACPAEMPDVGIGGGYDQGGFDIGASSIQSRFALPDERRLQLKDDVSWSHGKHTTKFGVDYNKVSDYINNLYNGYGNYFYDFAYSFIGDYLHATTGLGGNVDTTTGRGGYANANTTLNGTANFGLFTAGQGVTVPVVKGTPDSKGASGLLVTREYAGYATDDWRITPRLTLTLGVRYEYEYVPPNKTPNLDATFANYTPLVNTTNQPDDRNNVAPRLGFALNVFGDGKTTLRGGYGMYFGRIINSNILQTYQNSGGPGTQQSYTTLFSDTANYGNGSNCALIFPHIFDSLQVPGCNFYKPNISYLSDHLQNPQVHEADLALEQDMGGGYVFGITYMASFGRELNSSADVNLNAGAGTTLNYTVINQGVARTVPSLDVQPHGGKPAPLLQGTVPVKVFTGTRINSNPNYNRILRIASNVNTNYDALAFQLNKRYRNGFSMLSNFTWAHALDYNPYIGTGVPSNNTLDPSDLTKEYGNSSLDVRQRFVFAVTYQPQTRFKGWKDRVLGGWRFAPIAQAQTGLPYTPSINGYPAQSASGIRGANGAGTTANRIEELRRNQYYRPKTAKVDLRVGKNFYFNVDKFGLERVRLEFFGEVFNIANHQNITGINNGAYSLSFDGSNNNYLVFQPSFGTYTNSNSNYTYTPRQLQLAVRVHF